LTIPRFYCALPLAAGSEIALPEGAAQHAVRALRLQPGDAITLFDGSGGEYTAVIAGIKKTAVQVALGAHHAVERESPLDVTLVPALATGDRMDWIVQKAVELGVTRIQPVVTRRSVLRLDSARAEKRIAHWQAIAIGACEQCGRNRVPEVLAVRDLAETLADRMETPRIVLAPDDGVPLASLGAPAGPIALLVGPEGGFADQELEAMRRAQCRFVRLGARVLRTETAGIAALAAIQTLWGDWQR
jgi:16S rRNA (uracil1498-N3)-methyltransferase